MGRLTPLCPAGHLPLKGGDWPSRPASRRVAFAGHDETGTLMFSPLEGEMGGSPEGGALAPATA